jgi:transposase
MGIAYKSNEHGTSRSFDAETYTKRNVIGRLFGRLKECRCVATRYENPTIRCHAILKIACIRYLLTKVEIAFLNTA